eukprot:jgi/Botrbrau1/17738/Bobra.0127s0003.1
MDKYIHWDFTAFAGSKDCFAHSSAALWHIPGCDTYCIHMNSVKYLRCDTIFVVVRLRHVYDRLCQSYSCHWLPGIPGPASLPLRVCPGGASCTKSESLELYEVSNWLYLGAR